MCFSPIVESYGSNVNSIDLDLNTGKQKESNDEKKKDLAVDNSIYYKASNVSRSDISDNVVVLEGNAEVKNRSYTITGDRIIFNTKSNIFESILLNDGFVRTPKRIKITNSNGDVVYCSGVRYNINNGIGVARNVLIFKDKVIVLARRAKMDYDGTFYLKDVSLTSCKKKNPDWAIILDKAIVFKKNLFFMYGSNLMFSGTYFPFLKAVSIPYLMPVEGKAGLKYPSSISFGNNGGLAIKEFGFYIPIGLRRDINFDISFFIGDASVSSSLYYRYLIPNEYQGVVLFSLSKISLYRNVYGFDDSFRTNWSFKWKHVVASFHSYEINADFDIRGENSEVADKDFDKDKKDLKIFFNFKKKSFLKYFCFDGQMSYTKSGGNKIEEFLLPKITISNNSNLNLRYISVTPVLSFVFYRSNKNAKKYVADKHDIVLADDKLANTEIINKENIKMFFKNFSCSKLKNSLEKFSLEGKVDLPIKFDIWLFSNSLIYKCRLFFSRYNIGKDKIEFRKLPYYIHNIYATTAVNFKLKSNGLKFNEFSTSNLFKIKSIFLENDSSFELKYVFGVNKMQKWFNLQQPYGKKDKKLDLFYHTYFGNLENNESVVLSFKVKNSVSGIRFVDGGNRKFTIFDIIISSGYDFFKKKCKLDDINIALSTSIWRFNINVDGKIFLYQYGNVDSDGKRHMIDKFFFDNPSKSFFNAFKSSVMSFDINVNFALKKNNNDGEGVVPDFEKGQKKEEIEKKNFYDEKDYEKLYIIDNLSIFTKYCFSYKYNPVVDRFDITHTVDLNLSTKLSRKCSVNLNIKYNIKDKYLSDFGLNGVYDLHCWNIKFNTSVSVDKKREVDFNYNVSLIPLVEKFSFLSQNRDGKLSVV